MQTPQKILWFILSIFLILPSQAQDSPITFSAYLDTYYSYDFSNSLNNQRLYVTQYDRHNEFNINHAWLKANYNKGKVRSELALQVGSYPINNYGAEPDPFYRMIYSAYVGYQVTEKSWVDVGIMGGHFGYESALALDRELLSPALATEYTPYYQTGLKYTWAVTPNTEIRAVVLNGWQNIVETNNKKSVGLAVDQTIGEKLFLSYGNYYGNERSAAGPDLMRFHNNFIVQYKPQEKLALTGIFDVTNQDSVGTAKNAYFLTGIVSYRLRDEFRVAGRYEYVKDSDRLLINSISPPFDMHVLSVAFDFRPQDNVSFKFEPKLYTGNRRNFQGRDGFGASSLVLNAGFALRLE
jgi:hypothetical protein